MDDLVVAALRALVPGGVRRGELRRNGRALRWVEAGQGSPAVVLDAGLGEPGSLAWAGVLGPLAARTRVIAYDRAGVGASDPVPRVTTETAVGDLAAMAADAAGGRAVLVGHSWGGLLVQMAALRDPGVVAGVVLVDPVHEEVWAAAPWWARALQASYGVVPALLRPVRLQGQAVRTIYRPFARRLTTDPGLQRLFLDAYASCYDKPSQVRAIRQENRLGRDSVESFRDARLSAPPAVPTTVLSARRGLPARMRRPWTRIQRMLAESVGGEHIVVDSGHSIHQERPDIVADAVLRVLERALSRPRAGRLPAAGGADGGRLTPRRRDRPAVRPPSARGQSR